MTNYVQTPNGMIYSRKERDKKEEYYRAKNEKSDRADERKERKEAKENVGRDSFGHLLTGSIIFGPIIYLVVKSFIS